ncbi:MAG: hypothetical protein QF775_00530 [archaeon]|nr:hypothetical protein [archaeon]
MKKILYKDTLVGIKISSLSEKTSPITDEKEPLQVVTLKHPKEAYLVAHTHTPQERTTAKLQECLIVKKGRIKIDLYGPNKVMFREIELSEGEMFILQNGGYGIHMLEDSEVIEVKNGPFIEDKEMI